MAAQYRDEDIGADMYKIMQWLEPKIVRDAARKQNLHLTLFFFRKFNIPKTPNE